MNGWIEETEYKKIQAKMPIPCVDLLVVHQDKVLLMLRKNEPAKGSWFTPGGRILKDETFEASVRRILAEETGLEPIRIQKKGVMAHIHPEIHTVTVFFRVDVEKDDVKIDDQHSDYRWITEIEESLHPYVKQMIAESKILIN